MIVYICDLCGERKPATRDNFGVRKPLGFYEKDWQHLCSLECLKEFTKKAKGKTREVIINNDNKRRN